MATKVARTGIERESGWLYFLDKKGHVSRVRMARGGGKIRKTKPQLVAKANVTRESATPCPHSPSTSCEPQTG